jgi:putative oxidoreductase
MNTLSIFPDLLTFWLLAPFILRVTVGFIFIYFGVSKIWREQERRIGFFKKIGFGAGIIFFWLVSTLEIIGGALLVLGLYTQPTALVLSFVALGAIYSKIRHPKLLDNTLEFYVLLLSVLISLLFLGAGFWAIDLPL